MNKAQNIDKMNQDTQEYKYLNNLFDIVRIVDPTNKTVINDNKVVVNHKCYDFWKNEEACENCISVRAYNEKKSFVKVECVDKKIYWIMATPATCENGTYIIETLRDISDVGIVNDMAVKSAMELKEELANMNKLVVTDTLVGCYNRRYIDERLPVDIKRTYEDNTKLSIAMMDIDHFKVLNDQYGHLAGDYILKKLIEVISNNIRGNNDWVARYGGEEFIIIFNNTSREKALELIERIREIISTYIFNYDNNKINITVSFGVYELNMDNDTIEDLLKKVDLKLYEAKRAGRNLVVG